MNRPRPRDFHCPVVNEQVRITLRGRASVGLRKVEGYFVQCDQTECQYATENVDPCPLRPSMFADDIAEMEEAKRRMRERAS